MRFNWVRYSIYNYNFVVTEENIKIIFEKKNDEIFLTLKKQYYKTKVYVTKNGQGFLIADHS